MTKTTTAIIAAVIVIVIVAVIAMWAGGTSRTQTPTSATQAPTLTTTSPTQTPTQTTTTQTQTTPSVRGVLTGAGSTFIAPQLQAWSNILENATGGALAVNYQLTGSGAGISLFLNKKVDFGASDVPMPEDLYQKYKGQFVQFPAIIGSIVIAYNVPEIAYNKTGKYLNLTSEIIALIYMGNITQWCDPRIKAINPGLAAEPAV
jgi:phosphate transport system substrate-binding protein